MSDSIVNRAADNIRVLSAAMVEHAKSGHPGGAMGGADFINILYSEFLHFDPDDMAWPNRDRFFLDPGHMSPMLYAILTLTGAYSMEDIMNFRQWRSPTPGHPELNVQRGVENTSGPLGQGHAMAVGAAIAERFLVTRFGEWMAHKTYTLISDGGIQEEISQGAGRLAGFLGLGNLIMFYDSNDIQLSTGTNEVTCEDTAKKYEAWGWEVTTIDGNNPEEIRKALKEANEVADKPSLIIGKTIMGKGCITEEGEPFEKQTSTHGMPISKAGASYSKTIEKLGGDPENPFQIFPEVKEYFVKILEGKRKFAAAKKEEQKKWESLNPELAKKRNDFLAGRLPEIDFREIIQKENAPTRGASGTVLGFLAGRIENMIVASADLSNSDKTDGFLAKSKAFKRGDFTGAFLQAGVSELTMAALMNGLAAHGGIIPVCGTFFVFSDYMKPAVRLAALMELPVKYIWSHDAFRVGEDGPTHQPVEQEAQIRLMEKMKNHSGKRCFLALRPADATETTVAWKMALANRHTPSALLLSRQAVNDLPVNGSSRFEDALQAEKGAYIVQKDEGEPDIVLVASGSEVATLLDCANILREKEELKVQIVSAISEGLFREQSGEYQKNVIPEEVPVFGLTAGLPVTMQGLVGPKGITWGLESFGFSAPYKVLDEKLGFTGQNVYEQVMKYLKAIGEKP
jgi:transketolase